MKLIEFILPYLVKNFQINARYKLTAKSLLTFSHYTQPHLEYGGEVYVKNKLYRPSNLFVSLQI